MSPLWLAVSCVLALGDGNSPETLNARASVVTVGEIPAVTILPGDSATVTVEIKIADGFHIQANPAANEFLVPLELVLDGEDGIAFRPPLYPEAVAFRLEGTTDDLATYRGLIRVSVPVLVSADVASGSRVIAGVLRYQACDSTRCLFPAAVRVKFDLVVPGAD